MTRSKPQKESNAPVGVFVYGTLMSGLHNHGVAKRLGIASIEEAYIDQHLLYELDWGYPTILPGEGRVWGELLKFENLGGALIPLDELESVGEEYVRVRCSVRFSDDDRPAVDAWVYQYPTEDAVVRSGGRKIESGRYRDL